MKVVVAPDGFGGTLSAVQAGHAIADGWLSARPDDTVVTVPMSDGGEGFLDVVTRPDDARVTCEVADPRGRPIDVTFVVRASMAIIESARACGLMLLELGERDPRQTTTFGVGQLLAAAQARGVERIMVGVGGSATVDGGAGALTGLGFRVCRADGSGLKIGGAELAAVDHVGLGWAPSFAGIDVDVLADVDIPLDAAATMFGPQKGADAAAVSELDRGIQRWAGIAERDLAGGANVRTTAGAGAGGGLAFGLACGIGARIRGGAAAVAELVELDRALDGADAVVTGEGQIDATSLRGKVFAEVRDRAMSRGLAFAAVAGRVTSSAPDVERLAVASADGPGPDPAGAVAAAAQRLAGHW